MSVWQRITLAAVATILVYQLLLPPIVGLADQGDYARVIGHFGYGPTVKEFNDRYYFFLNRTYTRDAQFKTKGWESFTSQYFFIAAALACNKLLSKDGLFDLRVLGSVHILAFLAATFFLLRALRRLIRPPAQVLISLALALMFCDVGYVSYFNSFFTEPASYLFLLALLAVWLDMIAQGGPDTRHLALLGVFGVCFTTAKPQNTVAGMILALYVLRLRGMAGAPRRAAALCSLALAAAAIGVYLNTPAQMKQAAVYDVMFMTIIPGSPDQAAALRSFGLDPALVKYSGTAAYSPNTIFWQPEFQRDFAKHVSQLTILGFYARHPARFAKVVADVLPRSTSIRAEFSANFEKSSGYPSFTKSRGFAAWSRFRDRWLSHVAGVLLALLVLSVPAAAWFSWTRRASAVPHLLAECYGVLALLAVLAFFSTVMADSLDMVKHLFLYDVLTDVCLVFTLAGAAVWAGGRNWSERRWTGLAFHYLNRDRRKTAQAGL